MKHLEGEQLDLFDEYEKSIEHKIVSIDDFRKKKSDSVYYAKVDASIAHLIEKHNIVKKDLNLE